jgi:hypothetical protein
LRTLELRSWSWWQTQVSEWSADVTAASDSATIPIAELRPGETRDLWLPLDPDGGGDRSSDGGKRRLGQEVLPMRYAAALEEDAGRGAGRSDAATGSRPDAGSRAGHGAGSAASGFHGRCGDGADSNAGAADPGAGDAERGAAGRGTHGSASSQQAEALPEIRPADAEGDGDGGAPGARAEPQPPRALGMAPSKVSSRGILWQTR